MPYLWSLKGKGGRDIPGGAATILLLRLDPAKTVASLNFGLALSDSWSADCRDAGASYVKSAGE